ncbi:DNA cytosine methyltransferase [Tamlana sp. 2201CG12-4]|uniref:DNA cytosine methyltransferase n=1 Tax=Tamlana sp. 2201CG12-4 TaxID=3112582 RepID=UPI002DBF5FA1|nr:DNA cytosine methyltransferase [Tamlana sp. 2201CG12-4]MEC3906142.1 DNA cytosine methyltransferase [Tamlana sp. 2201CG12-4]
MNSTDISNETGLTVFSAFDGISIGQLALKQLGIKINKYYASEIDPNPIKVTQHHFPETVQLGDIRNIDANTLPKIDLVLCGSSCQDLSVMNKVRLGLQGNKSSVFFDAVRILNVIREKNPNCIFLFENVIMPSVDKQIFTELLGVKAPVNINSGLLGPAFRNRLYFTNLNDITIPEDRGTYLNDVIENGMLPPNTKGKCILTRGAGQTVNALHRHLKRSVGNVVYLDEQYCNLSKRFKKIQLEQIENDQSVKRLFRPISILEAERCMTIPDGYTAILKPTARLKCLGNAFHLETIKYILRHSGLIANAIKPVPSDNAVNSFTKVAS